MKIQLNIRSMDDDERDALKQWCKQYGFSMEMAIRALIAEAVEKDRPICHWVEKIRRKDRASKRLLKSRQGDKKN